MELSIILTQEAPVYLPGQTLHGELQCQAEYETSYESKESVSKYLSSNCVEMITYLHIYFRYSDNVGRQG